MKERILVIYEREEKYATQLSGYLNRNPDFPYRIAVFTNQESLEGYLAQGQADLLLLGEDCHYEASPCQRILLTTAPKEEWEEPWIFKYQSAGNIMREITAYAALPDVGKEEGGSAVYTVFATKAGQERTEYARQLVRKLRQQGEVLYVNMDLFPSIGQMNRSGNEGEWKGMSEVVYYLKQGGEQCRWKIKGMIGEEDGIPCLRPAHCSMDLMELTPEDATELIRILRGMQEFQAVVLEVGFYNETMLELCRFSEVIHLVTPPGEDYNGSTEFFMGQLALMQHEGIERKVEVIQYGGTGEKTEVKRRTSVTTGLFQRVER